MPQKPSRSWHPTFVLSLTLLAGIASARVAAGDERTSTYAGKSAAQWQELLAAHLGKDSDADKEQCRRAAQALGQFGPAARDVVPLLIEALQSPSVEVRHFAVDALGRIGPEAREAVLPIVEEVDLPKDHVNYAPLAYFRRLAARALGRIGSSATEAVPVLQKALENEDPSYRLQAALALWKIARHPAALAALVAGLREGGAEEAFEAVTALSEIGSDAKPAAPALVEALAHEDPDVRRAAAEVLVGFGQPTLEPVARLLSTRPAAPEAAAFALGELLAQQRQSVFYNRELDRDAFLAATRPVVRLAAPVLAALLADQREEVHQTAVRALSQMGLLAAPFLLQTLKGNDPAARQNAIKALQRLEPYLPSDSPSSPGMEMIKPRLVADLMELMKHDEVQVRTAAYRAFAAFSLGPAARAAVPLLRSALRAEDVSIARYAYEALQQLPQESETDSPRNGPGSDRDDR
jgi:HEAT repeat protein